MVNPSPEMSNEERNNILVDLTAVATDWVLPHGAIVGIADARARHPSTISRLWQRALQSRTNSDSNDCNVSHRKFNCGRPLQFNRDELEVTLVLLPLSRRGTLRSMAEGLKVSSGTAHRLLHEVDAVVRVHTSAVKPTLTEENAAARYAFAVNEIEPNGLYKAFHDRIHINEKWVLYYQDKSALLLG